MSQGSIAVAGALAQRPGRGGHAWVFLQYLLGFRRLGWDVLFVDRLEPGMVADEQAALDGLAATMSRFDLEGCWTVLRPEGDAGLPRAETERRLRQSDLLLNVMGYLDDEDLLACAPRRVFLDIDPGFTQMWHALQLADLTAGHDVLVTVGENVGRVGCAIPTNGARWFASLPPVVLDQWPLAYEQASAVTGIGTWRGPYGPLRFDGVDYGLRVHEFRRLADLPRACSGTRFEYALDIDAADSTDVARLEEGGWRLLEPVTAAGSPALYRQFIQTSLAEIMVAKSMYVRSRSGWFSDRSVCYLASGRPVIAQDTGRAERFDAGLLTFKTLDDAQAAVGAVLSDYRRHHLAAREIAETYFDSDRVLPQLLQLALHS